MRWMKSRRKDSSNSVSMMLIMGVRSSWVDVRIRLLYDPLVNRVSFVLFSKVQFVTRLCDEFEK